MPPWLDTSGSLRHAEAVKQYWFPAVALLGLAVLISWCAGDPDAIHHRFPREVTLSTGIARGNEMWAFGNRPREDASTSLPIALAEVVVHRLDSRARLLSEASLGAGALRAVDRLDADGLALLAGVGDGDRRGAPSVLHVTHDAGATWAAGPPLPPDAIGAGFLGPGRIAVWWCDQAAVSEDRGKTWRQIPANDSRLKFWPAKIPAPAGAPPGVLLAHASFEAKEGNWASEIGLLDPDGDFHRQARLPGRIEAASLDPEGRLWLATEDDAPTTKVVTIEDLFGRPRVRTVREIAASLPEQILATDRTVVLAYAERRLATVWPVRLEVVSREGAQAGAKWRRLDVGPAVSGQVFFDGTSALWLYEPFGNRLSYRAWPAPGR